MARRFSNLDPTHRPQSMRAIVRWGVVDRVLGRRRIERPGPPAPSVAPDHDRIRSPEGPPRLTWIGHASFLLQAGGRSVLVDPMFSARAGWFYRRFAPPGLAPDDLPPIDALLVSHAHYDHLDAPSVRALAPRVPVFAPLELGRWFRRRGFTDVRELGWWETAERDGVAVTLVPARHWSRRRVADTNRTLWGGFVVAAGGVRVYHAGDTAWFGGFLEIGRRFPGLAAAMLPIGSYAPAWFMEHHHLNPEQAGRAFLDTGARCMIPMHWGTFQLTDEPLSEPVERLRSWWRAAAPDDGRRLRVLAIGETVALEE